MSRGAGVTCAWRGRGWAVVMVAALAAIVGALRPSAEADAESLPAGALRAGPAPTSGLHPLANDAEVPLAWMPPGSKESPVPSDEIFPPQTITVRFHHQKHVEEFGLSCKTCHDGAFVSMSSKDRLLPDPARTCDACHDADHSDLANVTTGGAPHGQCSFCHLGAGASTGQVARFVLPDPNLRFPHKLHLDRNIQCGQCHGQVEKLELATRDQLPRMAGCYGCHALPSAARGEARGECTTCHLTEPNGRMQVSFETGPLVPPGWLHMSAHTPDWIERHGDVAANDSRFCQSCHQEDECASCHDGRVRDRKVHPNDWISMHSTAARLDNPRCASCHQQQTFCADCHRRVGVARDGPLGNRPAGARFHPPPAEWTTAPRGPNHHAWEAQRNLNACVSCHAERDCATCHATRGVGGGQGVNPHPLDFQSKCATAFAKNPRPCLTCHVAGDRSLSACR